MKIGRALDALDRFRPPAPAGDIEAEREELARRVAAELPQPEQPDGAIGGEELRVPVPAALELLCAIGVVVAMPVQNVRQHRFRHRRHHAGIDQPGERDIQDRAIRAVVKKQEAIGLEGITDGELRRAWWHLDFLSQLEGVTLRDNPGPKFGGTEEQPPIPAVTGKLRYAKPIMVEDFSFLRENTGKTAKFTIPSPSMLHLRAGRAGISRAAYPDLEEFWSDAATAYRAAIAAFGKAGCTYL